MGIHAGTAEVFTDLINVQQIELIDAEAAGKRFGAAQQLRLWFTADRVRRQADDVSQVLGAVLEQGKAGQYRRAGHDHALRSARQVWCAFVFDRDILDPLPRQDRRVE
jgi:hypothetical protein